MMSPLRVWKSRATSAWFVDCALCPDEEGEQVYVGHSQRDAFKWAQVHWHEHNPYDERGPADRSNVIELPINFEL